MPTENERKYVLSLKFAEDFEELKKTLGDTLRPPRILKQAYLYGDPIWNLRLRQEVLEGETLSLWCMKYNVGERVVELEHEISERDFDDLWAHTKRHLTKHRYDLYPDDKTKWEIDLFFDDDGKVYFVLAEHEMPESQKKPQFIPYLIAKYLVYAVPPEQQFQYSSFNLADQEWSKSAYQAALDLSEESETQSQALQSAELPEDTE